MFYLLHAADSRAKAARGQGKMPGNAAESCLWFYRQAAQRHRYSIKFQKIFFKKNPSQLCNGGSSKQAEAELIRHKSQSVIISVNSELFLSASSSNLLSENMFF